MIIRRNLHFQFFYPGLFFFDISFEILRQVMFSMQSFAHVHQGSEHLTVHKSWADEQMTCQDKEVVNTRCHFCWLRHTWGLWAETVVGSDFCAGSASCWLRKRQVAMEITGSHQHWHAVICVYVTCPQYAKLPNSWNEQIYCTSREFWHLIHIIVLHNLNKLVYIQNLMVEWPCAIAII